MATILDIYKTAQQDALKKRVAMNKTQQYSLPDTTEYSALIGKVASSKRNSAITAYNKIKSLVDVLGTKSQGIENKYQGLGTELYTEEVLGKSVLKENLMRMGLYSSGYGVKKLTEETQYNQQMQNIQGKKAEEYIPIYDSLQKGETGYINTLNTLNTQASAEAKAAKLKAQQKLEADKLAKAKAQKEATAKAQKDRQLLFNLVGSLSVNTSLQKTTSWSKPNPVVTSAVNTIKYELNRKNITELEAKQLLAKLGIK